MILFLFYPLLILAACSFLYHLAVAWAALRFRAEREDAADFAPPVSVLKPIHRIEQNFYASLASFFRQEDASFEVLFGLGEGNDPARWTLAQLQRDFPRVPVVLIPLLQV